MTDDAIPATAPRVGSMKRRILDGLGIEDVTLKSQSYEQEKRVDGSISQVPMLVGAEWRTSDSKRSAAVYNPSTGDVIAQTPLCTANDVDRVVHAAESAFEQWSA